MTTFEALAAAPIGEVSAGLPVFVTGDQTVAAAIEIMAERDIGSVLVVDDKEALVGIFTENDVCQRVDLSTDDWRKHAVSKYMTSPVKTVSKTTAVATALRLMTTRRIRHLPVVDDGEGKAVGVVSIRYIIEFIAGCFPKEFINLPPSPDHETSEIQGG